MIKIILSLAILPMSLIGWGTLLLSLLLGAESEVLSTAEKGLAGFIVSAWIGMLINLVTPLSTEIASIFSLIGIASFIRCFYKRQGLRCLALKGFSWMTAIGLFISFAICC